MKRCPICQTTFPDDANFCPMDAGRLDIVGAAPSGPPPGAPAPTVETGMVGARFRLGARLGGGRTGEVYAGQDTTTGQDCAVKLVSPAVFPTPLVAQRTERELKQLHKIGSDRVAKILDFGHHGPSTWVAMELVHGTSLERLIAERGRLAEDRARRIATEVGEALAEAAKIGVIHRDVSPKNIILVDGDRVKVINFSLPVPLSDKIFGVAEFVSPEQAEGKAVDQRSNIYSLGALLYTMLVGQPPFVGDPASVIQAHLHSVPVPPSQRVQGLPMSPELEKVVMKALEKSSSRRHLTLRQLITEIEGTGGPASAMTAPPARPAAAPEDAGRTMFGYAVTRSADGGAPAVVPAPVPAPAPMPAPAPVPVAAPPPVAIATPIAAPIAPPPAAAVSPAPAVLSSSPAKGKAKGQAEPPPSKKGQFRETMWFKKGELDEAAAQAAALAAQTSPDAPVPDKADELPMEDRYKDDGSISARDRERLSLKTGHTQMLQAVKDAPRRSGDVSEDELVSELRSGRTKVILLVLAILAAIGGVVAWSLLR